MALVYDFLFFAFNVPVYFWHKSNATIYAWGLCTSDPAWTECFTVLLFLTAWLIFQKIIFVVFSLYDNFVIEEQAGYNRMSKCSYFKEWVKGIVLTIILYWALVALMLTIIKLSGD